jgi:hypothetical protein
MENTKLDKLVNDGLNANDNGFCTVIALAVAFDKTYQEAAQIMRGYGRRYRKGMHRHAMEYAIQTEALKHGYSYSVYDSEHVRDGEIRVNAHRRRTEVSVQEKFGVVGKMTVNNCLRYLNPKKKYIIGVRGHAVAVAEGKVQDWTEGRRHQVKHIIELDAPSESPQKPEIKPIIKKASMSLDDMISLL